MSGHVKLSRKAAQSALDYLANVVRLPDSHATVTELRAALKPRLSKPMRRARVEGVKAARAAKNAETASIRAAVFLRAGGRCEHCGRHFGDLDPGELDHFFGRGKVPQTDRNTWALCRGSHREKTKNDPSASYWLVQFIAHAERHGFSAEAERARKRLDALTMLPKAGGAR